jgi:WD40 repeat protein
VGQVGAAAVDFAYDEARFDASRTAHDAPVNGVAFSPDGRHLLTTSADSAAKARGGKGGGPTSAGLKLWTLGAAPAIADVRFAGASSEVTS